MSNSIKNTSDKRGSHLQFVGKTYFSIFISAIVLIRMVFADSVFSFDYLPYINIISIIGGLSYSEILRDTLDFPYTYVNGVIPIEFGFSLIVKTISLIGVDPAIVLAVIAAASVGLRVYVMRSLGVPIFWILLINLYAITMFEANALRLGLASSVLLFGIYRIHENKVTSGLIFMGLSSLLHLQTILFIVPLLAFLVIFWRFGQSVYTLYTALAASGVVTVLATQYLPILGNEKIQEYITRGVSTSSGFTITSILAIIFTIFLTIAISKSSNENIHKMLFSAVSGALFVSVVLLVYLTDVAVIGDRAWQLGYVIAATFFFSDWSSSKLKKIPNFILLVLSIVMVNNVLIRYPLSNFFSPPFPQIYF